jgi:hypothetical protein
VRITAQLIDARADRHLWAKSFERNSSDVLALQAELASAIAREINVRLTESEQTRLAARPAWIPPLMTRTSRDATSSTDPAMRTCGRRSPSSKRPFG